MSRRAASLRAPAMFDIEMSNVGRFRSLGTFDVEPRSASWLFPRACGGAFDFELRDRAGGCGGRAAGGGRG